MNLGSETNLAYVMPYASRIYKTGNGSLYSINSNGTISGRKHIEGAGVKYVVGVEPGIAEELRKYLDDSVPKSRFDEIIRKYGQEPREGLCLVVSLTSESAEKTNRKGMVASIIDKIDPPLPIN